MIAHLKRILFAEDSANDAELTLTALQSGGLANEIVWVRDGALALEYLERRESFANRDGGNPALVLLDLKMPKVTGLEVLRHIKTNPALKTIPVVVLTSSREEQDLMRSYEIGVNAYVVKPVDFQAFVAAIRELGQFWGLVNEPPAQHGVPASSGGDGR